MWGGGASRQRRSAGRLAPILLHSWALLLLLLLLLLFCAFYKVCTWQQRRQHTLKVRHVDRSADVSQRAPAISSTVWRLPKMI